MTSTDSSGPADRLRSALQSDASSVRLESALAAGTRPDPAFVEVLVQRCAIEPDFFVRDMLTWALLRHPASRTVPRLVYEVGADEPQARSQALHTLSKIGDPQGWSAISVALLRDPDVSVARSAWRTAAGLVPPGEKGWLAEELCSQLGRGSRETERSLSRAFAVLGEVALPALRARGADARASVRIHAAASEALVRDPEANFDALYADAERADAAGAGRCRRTGPGDRGGRRVGLCARSISFRRGVATVSRVRMGCMVSAGSRPARSAPTSRGGAKGEGRGLAPTPRRRRGVGGPVARGVRAAALLLTVASLLAVGTGPLSATAALAPSASDAAAALAPSASDAGGGVRSFFVPVAEAPGSSASIPLDVDLYTPAQTPAPAVLLAHGFGQTKADLAPEAEELQAAGYVVLAYTARGFGQSGGSIGLDSLDAEVPDARALVDVLAADPAVLKTGGGSGTASGSDPVVGAVGGSYGGALALMVGATDPRVDTVVAAITWNDLAEALVPASAGTVADDPATGAGSAPSPALRDFKSGWASRLFAAGIAPAAGGAPATPCGRFTASFCELYQTLLSGAQPSDADLALLARSSPSTVLSASHAPTLLLQGLQDNLFGLDQADANARQLAAAGAPVQVRWFNGGHDGEGIAGTDTIIRSWLADHLRANLPVAAAFSYAVPPNATAFGQTVTAAGYPGLGGADARQQVTLAGAEATVVNPPGGQPASVTGIPGLDTSSTAGMAASALLGAANPPAEQARFVSDPLAAPVLLAGAATVRVRVAPSAGSPAGAGSPAAPSAGSSGSPAAPGVGSAATAAAATAGEALLYAQLSVQTGDTTRALPGGVAPIRVALPADGADLQVALPATAFSLNTGDRLVLTLRTTDSQFTGSTDPAAFTVAVEGPIDLPTVAPASTDQTEGLPEAGVLAGIAATLLVGALLVAWGGVRGRRRRAREAAAATAPGASAPLEQPALQIDGLTKRFRSGFLAADDVSFRVERGQVLGLLGENGAGKTTTLRMVTGLLRPDSGTATAFGVPIVPGSPVLSRVGCFIEGPGFLPHLSGRRNLDLYWAATGRPRVEARFDEALAVADLGGAIAKPVRGYSQGMRQRLAIAQAMLGMPDLLILDEPTNGLDPPQITALRSVLRRYAEGDRTVIVSSHLLGEVELTCSHVVVMSHGRVVASGAVDEVAGGGRLETAFLSLIGATEPSA